MRYLRTGQIAFLCLFIPSITSAKAPVEELPPPARANAEANEAPVASEESPAKDQTSSTGWGLLGASGRHYFVGPLAIADYLRDGQRYIVTLAEEDPATHGKADPNFLYYREEVAGHRWAIGRQPHLDGTYSVYFQPSDTPATWKLIQHARANWDHQPVFESVEPVYLLEPTCGH